MSYSRYWTGTSLQCNFVPRVSHRGNIIKSRLSFTIEKPPSISLSCKLVPVVFREYDTANSPDESQQATSELLFASLSKRVYVQNHMKMRFSTGSFSCNLNSFSFSGKVFHEDSSLNRGTATGYMQLENCLLESIWQHEQSVREVHGYSSVTCRYFPRIILIHSCCSEENFRRGISSRKRKVLSH